MINLKLKWALTELRKQPKEPIVISGEVDLKENLVKRNSEILDVSPIRISGTIVPENMDQFLVTAVLNLEIVLPSTRSFQPTHVNLELPFTELYVSPEYQDMGEVEQDLVFQLEKHYIDLQRPIEDIILSSLPIKVLTEEEQNSKELPSGNDWELLSEEDYNKSKKQSITEEQEASPFAVLKDMFSEADE